MDAQQATKELERLQTEMMTIQAKYMADPTPENIAKMQQELTALSMKMAEITSQAVGGAMQDLNMDDIDFSLDDEDLKQFIKDNPVAPGKEKYMPIGALLIATHYEPWQTLALMGDMEYWSQVLSEGWGITDAKEGKKMLASLLEGRHYAKFGEEFRKALAGKPHKLDDESVESYNATMETINEYMPGFLPTAKKCDNIIAWDLDRVGYLARIFHAMGWLSEAETYEWLDKTGKRIKTEFKTWDEYIASIVIGRAVAFSFDEVVVETAKEIVEDEKEYLKKYPLSSL